MSQLYEEVIKKYLEKQISLSDVLAYGNNFGAYSLTLDFTYYQQILKNSVCTFLEFVQTMKKRQELSEVLSNSEFFRTLIYDLTITNYNLIEIVNQIDSEEELQCLCRNTFLLDCFIDARIFNSIQEFLEFFKQNNGVVYLLQNKAFFQCRTLSKSDYEKVLEICRSSQSTFLSLSTNLNVLENIFELELLTFNEYVEIAQKHKVLHKIVEFENFFYFLDSIQQLNVDAMQIVYKHMVQDKKVLFALCCWNHMLLKKCIEIGCATEDQILKLIDDADICESIKKSIKDSIETNSKIQ